MKIKKSPSKKLASLPSALSLAVKHLEQDPEDQIPIWTEKVQDWTFPRGDLFHWTHVLNRFDSILERICSEYDLDKFQTKVFDSSTKRLLLAITNFSRTLFENCTNRNIYNSYEHLNSLLNTSDMDVLEAVLRLMLRPAQRVNNPRAIRSSFIAPQDKSIELARGWSVDTHLASLCDDNMVITEEMTTLKLQYYLTRTDNNQENEGVNTISLQLAGDTRDDSEIFADLVKQHSIPLEYHFELANRIRIAKHINQPTERRQLLIIQILAIAIMAHTVSDTTAQNRVFVYEPHLVNYLAELIQPEKSIPYDVQTYALFALDAIARHRSKLSEILTAFNASANHGPLLHILRHINTDKSELPQGFLDALFTLLSYLLQTQTGGQMLMSAGIIPTLLHIVENQQYILVKNVTKVVGLLDTIVNSVSTSFPAFCNAGGLDILLARIKTEVENCIQATFASSDSMEVEPSHQTTEDMENSLGALAPHNRLSLVKTMLKFLIRMMESSGTADGLRNLIDSSLPNSLKLIMENPKVFGNSVFALTTNVITTFIHNEPTSLPILQEAKLPQSFLQTITNYDNATSEVLIAAVHAFGAICLNPPGLEMFNQVKPLPHFFDMMTSHEFLRQSSEIDASTNLGSTMDELIRHHPSLKPEVFSCITCMIKKVMEMGRSDVGKPSNNSHLLQLTKKAGTMDVEMSDREDTKTEDPKAEEKVECLLVSFIDLISRFLEGLFQNQSNIREFVKEGCPEMLLDFYSLPFLPADFSVSIASDSLAYLFRLITEVSPLPTVLAISEKVKQSIKNTLGNDDTSRTESMVKDFIDIKDDETEKIERGNKLFRQLIEMFGYVELLANICCSAILTHGKNGISLVNEFVSQDDNDNIILLLGHLHRSMVWETILLRESVPKSWYQFKPAKKGVNNLSTENPLGISSGGDAQSSTSEPSASSSLTDKKQDTPDAKDPRIMNIKHFKLFFSETPPALMPVFQGLIKVACSRRMIDTNFRHQALRLSELMTRIMKNSLTWSQTKGENAPPCKYDYLASMFSMISMLILDDRAQASFQTPLVVTFERHGAIDLLLEILDENWRMAEGIESIPVDQREDKDQVDLLPRIDTSIELLLVVLHHIGSPKLLHDSPVTAPLICTDQQSPNYFDPHEWMVNVHLKLSACKKHLNSPNLHQFPSFVLRTLLRVIMQIMKGEGEPHTGTEPRASGTTTSILGSLASPMTLVHAPLTPDRRGVQILEDMGFNRTAAEQAMVRCNNQIPRAVDYLFSHPTPMITSNTEASSNGQPPSQDNTTQESNDGSNADTFDESGDAPSVQDEDSDMEAADADEFRDMLSSAFDLSTRPLPSSTRPSRSPQSDANDKGKQKAPTARTVELNDIRSGLKDALPSILLDLVEKRDDMVFDVHDLLSVICKGEGANATAERILSSLTTHIEETLKSEKATSTTLRTQLRLMALMLKEQHVQPMVPETALRLSFLFTVIESSKEIADPDQPTPAWLPAVFLVLEAMISQSDESMINAAIEKLQKENNATSTKDDSDKKHFVMTDHQRDVLLKTCIHILKKTNVLKSDAYAVLRIIVRITKYNSVALQFVELGGLELLFNRPLQSIDGFKSHQAFIILILRHIIETKSVITEHMEQVIRNWLTEPRPRHSEVGYFLRGNAHFALRDLESFINVTTKLCKLSRYNETDTNRQIQLKSKEELEEMDASTEKTTTAVGPMEASKFETSIHHGSDARARSEHSDFVINHILNELWTVRHEKLEAPETTEDNEETKKKKADLKYGYTGFLLQCLAELVLSYESCKYDIYVYSRRRHSNVARPRHSLLNMLINDLLPYNAIKATEEKSRKEQVLSMWTVSVLVAMCNETGSKNKSETNTSGKNELTQIRKYVLESTIRSLKDAIGSTEPVAMKYSKYLVLADLCHRLLNAEPNFYWSLLRANKDDVSLEMAKLMLEKNFVATLTSAISDVDVNYPQAKTVLNAMLRPLEQLTKLAIKIENTAAKEDKKRDDMQAFVPTDSGEEDAPDLYRNSALGMFDGSVMEEDDMDDMGSSEEEDGISYDEDDYDEESGSDMSDMSEEELDDDDMDQEMDVVMHRHRYDSDMDEDEDESDEDDHDHDDSDEDSDHSLNTDESDDMDDEDGREMTWHLEDIQDEDGPVLHVRTEIEIDTDDEPTEHHRHRRHAPDAYDDESRDYDVHEHSDFDEDEESEAFDEDDGELNDGVLIDETDLDNPLLADELEANEGDALEDGWRAGSRSLGGIGYVPPFVGGSGLGYRRRMGFPRGGRLAPRDDLFVEHLDENHTMPLFDTGSYQVVSRPFRGHGDNRASTNNEDEVITHPLLTNRASSSATADRGMIHAPSRSQRLSGLGNLQAFEDIIGGSAVRMLENLLSQAPDVGHGETLRIDMSTPAPHTHRSAFDLEAIPHQPHTMNRSTPRDNETMRDIISILQDFHPLTTSQRWQQEVKMLYNDNNELITEKISKVKDVLVQRLIPYAKEEKKKLEEKEAQDRQRREEEEDRKLEAWKKILDEEKQRREAAEGEGEAQAQAQAQAEAPTQTEAQSQTQAPSQTQVPSEAQMPAPVPVQTETAAENSMDVSPEETPSTAGAEGATTEESTEQGRTTITINGEAVDISGTGIDVEFLEALPDDLREEVVNQHLQERRPSVPSAADDSISPEFLDALPPDIREEVLHQEAIERNRRDRQRQTSPGRTTAPATTRPEPTTMTSLDAIVRDFGGFLESQIGTINGSDEPAAAPFRSRLLPSHRHPSRREGEPSSSSSKKQSGHRDTIQLVDRAQLATLARLLFVPQSATKSLLNRLLLNLCENSKTRGDLLSLLICILQDGSTDLAAVDRSFNQLSLGSKAKQAPKTKSAVSMNFVGENVPNLITQRCLDFLHVVVSWNTQSLTYFLTENDSLANIKRSNSKKGKGKEKPTVPSKYPLLVLMSLLDRPVFINNSALMEQLMNLLAAMCRPFPLLVKKYEEKVENHQQQQQQVESQDAGDKASNEPSATPSVSTDKHVPKPPTIPEHYLKMVVHVLTHGECSSRTFQYTLGAISHLAALDGALQTVTNELVAAAKKSGEKMLRDLQELLPVLESAMSGTEIQGSSLAHFSAATSYQAKLLRVLKTLDYMYSRKSPSNQDDKDSEEEMTKNEKQVLQIYEDLEFLPLWKMLGRCLAVIHEKEELINVATVLLPLIESFMVVSKYATGKGQVQRLSNEAASPNPEQQAGAESPDDFFFAFTEDHKKILNIMVRNNPALMSGSFSLLVRNPKMLEFDNKRNYFVQQLHKRTEPREHFPPLQLNVRRQYVFEDSYHQLQGRTGEEIKYGKLMVRFYDEEGVDAGGVSREWFSVLARQMFNPNYALFITSAADKLTYQPNRASWVNPDHLSFFKFVGRVIGKAIYDGRLLDAYFTRSFYKHILNRAVDYRDVEAVDPEYYKSLVWMLDNDITDIIDLTFSLETDDFGTTKTVDLKPNGRDIPVTEANKHEYVKLVTEHKLTTAIKDQIGAFLQGFHDVVPAALIQIFNEQELELLISGLPDIDIDDWKNNTVYEGGYSPSSPQIQWFWRAVRSFDQEERAKLLQFATGTSKVPLEGFNHLQGSGGVQKFQIHKDFGGDARLPSAHTCFNQVDLPEYDCYENLRSSLFKAISECSTGFGFV
ncbi:uncharacterized protein BYT42DRAFT_522115 [Radiomyces spectabilis]|uniref:uncharacterized protein n=1 Tax=Radiomyces spectabilis TaxID=64574 RepID=UPI002220EC5E|nr:uncharacterized protein BYT42DRAFT_522115 [Radiomyces spectabilis]KAI8368284.1 hypothetical protein BYT42DRAFT_522115 [Radiomyces spectabilis]